MPPRADLTVQEQADRRTRKTNRINQLQMSPLSNIPVTLLMLWLSGNEIGMISIMMTFNAISAPISQLANITQAFVGFSNDPEVKEEVVRAKLIYFACCLVGLAIGLGKLHYMGLLPTGAADWLDHSPPQYISVARPGNII